MNSTLRLVQAEHLRLTHNCDRVLKCELLYLENEKTGSIIEFAEGNTTTLILVKGIT